MTLFHAIPPQMAFIAGKYIFSGNCTHVYGGTMTAGTADDECSAPLYWSPPFVSAPSLIASIQSGLDAGTTSPTIRFSGVTNCGCYVTIGQHGLSDVTLGILALGETKL